MARVLSSCYNWFISIFESEVEFLYMAHIILRKKLFSSFIFFITIWSFSFFDYVSAQIFKWEDEKGVFHYTDSLELVPPGKRTKPDLKIRTVYSAAKKEIKQDEKSSDAKENGEDSKEKDADSLNIDPKILERSISLFSSEIERDKKLSTYYPNSVNGKKINSQLTAGVGPKKELYQALLEEDTPAVQEAKSFLKTNIEEDQSVSNLGPRFKTNIRQTIGRLKSQLPIKEGILAKLKEELTLVNKKEPVK
jgi:hypothetical protein